MSPAELEAVEKRAAAATPGPWRTEATDWGAQVLPAKPRRVGYDRVIGDLGWGEEEEQGRADAAFIAAARTDVPALVAALKEARWVLREVEDYAAHAVTCETSLRRGECDCGLDEVRRRLAAALGER